MRTGKSGRASAPSASGPRPSVGDRAPEFTLPGPEGKPVSLAELLGKGPVVVYFYPKDETLGCTVEACGFRDTFDEFIAAGADVVGISRDDTASHARFSAHHQLPFRLLSDPTGEVHARYGVARQLGIVPERITFVVDRDGIVRHVVSSMVRMRAHVNESLAVVRKLASSSSEP